MPRVMTLMMMAVLVSLTGCASWRGGLPSCDGSARRPVGSVPDRTSLVPEASNPGGHNGQS